MPLRLIFMGTPEFAVPTLLELVAHGHEIAAVYTRAPKPAGRGMKLQPTPVEQEAARLGTELMVRAMAALERGALQLTRQSADGVTYAAKIEKAEAKIDWSKPAHAVLRHIHGLSPFPGAWSEVTVHGEAVRVKILRC